MSRLRLAKISAPSAPPSTTLELFYSSTDLKLEAIDENGKLAVLGGFAASDYRLIRVFWITASGTQAPGVSGTNPYTYTPTTGARALYVECIGGGGGGGGCPTTSSNASAGGGGGSGGYSASFLTGIATSYAVTIGGGGAGGVGGANGSAGTATTFGSSLITANAGTPGSFVASGTASNFAGNGNGGAAGTVPNIADIALPGNAGGRSVVVSGTLAAPGQGAASFLGGQTQLFWCTTGSGINGGNTGTPGAGGMGAIGVGSLGAFNGGAGVAGTIRVWEFA